MSISSDTQGTFISIMESPKFQEVNWLVQDSTDTKRWSWDSKVAHGLRHAPSSLTELALGAAHEGRQIFPSGPLVEISHMDLATCFTPGVFSRHWAFFLLNSLWGYWEVSSWRLQKITVGLCAQWGFMTSTFLIKESSICLSVCLSIYHLFLFNKGPLNNFLI